MKIYTLGYTGRTPAQLAELTQELNAIVVDCRFSPRSRVPHWNKGPLLKVLGDRYAHFQSFGNENYKSGGEIKLVNYDHGRQLLELAHKTTGLNFILMCGCADPNTCHRNIIAQLLWTDGYEVEELPAPEKKPKNVKPILPLQMTLFGF